MKFSLGLLMLMVLFSSSHAAVNDQDIDYCYGREACHKGHIPLLRSGTYYAHGVGRTCEEAKKESQDLFMRTYGNMECGLIAGPWVWDCHKNGEQDYSAWTKCNPDSGPVKASQGSNSRCIMLGKKLICN